jgi:hypothetical protein
MTHPWIVVIAVLGIGVLYVLLPLVADTFRRYRRSRVLRCPETGGQAEVGVDASRAAFTSAFGRPQLRAESCSLWPEKEKCAQDCLTLPDVEMPAALRLQAH